MPFDWNVGGGSYDSILNTWKKKFGAEVIEAILSIPDTATFIEFIYEEAAQTLLFALYNAVKAGDKETARAILDYLKLELLPDAVNFVSFWGNLAPHTKTCFERFFDAVDLSAQAYENILAMMGKEEGVLTVYCNVEDAEVYVDGEYKGLCGPVDPLKLNLSVGSHGVEVKKEGYKTAARNVNISPGEYQILKVNLQKIES